jgi:cobalt-zinc-cadmium efflux system outer membrane protein
MDLPFFNRNQGNIAAARASASRAELELRDAEIKIRNEVASALKQAEEIDQTYKKYDEAFWKSFRQIFDGLLKNFEKRNITLLEFLDFYETYKDARRNMNLLQKERMAAFEQLNFATGKNLFQP